MTAVIKFAKIAADLKKKIVFVQVGSNPGIKVLGK